MSKWYSKEKKIKFLKQVESLSHSASEIKLNISNHTIKRWRRELNNLGEDSLIPGKGIQLKGKRQGMPRTIDLNEMTKEELIKYIEVMNDLKKYLEISTKGKY